jgi:hypothetical protein
VLDVELVGAAAGDGDDGGEGDGDEVVDSHRDLLCLNSDISRHPSDVGVGCSHIGQIPDRGARLSVRAHPDAEEQGPKGSDGEG